eukprot:TRINITY_DN29989_c0_g1_i1.p1 TRINITY_DN29989_c0_g1~~TRINITY_DN29989_c0_g1_i1.p1  ORF type:complete len:222 (-),score=35.60 TRINITY_DN29989_c0_g1_i1:70-735(-)
MEQESPFQRAISSLHLEGEVVLKRVSSIKDGTTSENLKNVKERPNVIIPKTNKINTESTSGDKGSSVMKGTRTLFLVEPFTQISAPGIGIRSSETLRPTSSIPSSIPTMTHRTTPPPTPHLPPETIVTNESVECVVPRVRPSLVKDWTVSDVTTYLEEVGIDYCTQLFEREEISGKVFLVLTDEDLREFSLTLGKRKSILIERDKLKVKLPGTGVEGELVE